MPFSLEQFAHSRPYLYHLTARENLSRILSTRELFSAQHWLAAAGRNDLLTQKREGVVRLSVNGTSVLIRDQAPLFAGNIAFEDGWSLEDVVSELNRHVFFWPGTEKSPIDYGERHYRRYENTDICVLRIRSESVFSRNDPFFSKHNSGSPRCSGGKKSPRGSDTFVTSAAFPTTPSKVVEVTFRDRCILPSRVEVSDNPFGGWEAL